jgi:hypothetical protein
VWVSNVIPRPHYPQDRERRLGGAHGRSGRVRKISSPTGIRSPSRPGRSESLYRLRYRGPPVCVFHIQNCFMNSFKPGTKGEKALNCYWQSIYLNFKSINSFLLCCGPTRARASSFVKILDHTQRRTTDDRTLLDECSARRWDLYLTTHTTLTTDIHPSPPGWIRNYNLRRRAAAGLRLRPRDHSDRPKSIIQTL